ncbi:MAG TPA: hypothetical protein VH593_05905 [Ktedonobacteraceae bacterium]|jgi:hypothetical protein
MSSPLAERAKFGLKHPDLNPYITEVFGTYGTCQHRAPNTYDEVYSHIYGDGEDGEDQGCLWCKETVKRKKKHRQLFEQSIRTK